LFLTTPMELLGNERNSIAVTWLGLMKIVWF
jgi:hypothetical protein